MTGAPSQQPRPANDVVMDQAEMPGDVAMQQEAVHASQVPAQTLNDAPF